MYTRDSYTEAFTKLLNTSPTVGDTYSVCEYEAARFVCRHTGKTYLALTMDCRIDLENGPKKILVGYFAYRGPHLKCYLENQEYTNSVHTVEVTRVTAKSATVKVIN